MTKKEIKILNDLIDEKRAKAINLLEEEDRLYSIDPADDSLCYLRDDYNCTVAELSVLKELASKLGVN